MPVPNKGDDFSRVMRILSANKQKNFVKRILNPSRYPTLDLGGGQFATHKMAWGSADGKYYVYPSILFDGKKLTDYGDRAFDVAMKTGNVIEFGSPEEADWFSKNYKVVWDR